jgi:hypothetical protein
MGWAGNGMVFISVGLAMGCPGYWLEWPLPEVATVCAGHGVVLTWVGLAMGWTCHVLVCRLQGWSWLRLVLSRAWLAIACPEMRWTGHVLYWSSHELGMDWNGHAMGSAQSF